MADQIIDIVDQPNIAGEGALGNDFFNFVKIMALLEMVANWLGKLEIFLVTAMYGGGVLFTLPSKDFVIISMTSLFEGICMYCGSPENNMQQSAPFYWFQLFSAITIGVLSLMQLSLQDFGKAEQTYKANRDIVLNVFYGVAFAETLLLLARCYLLKRPFGTEGENIYVEQTPPI